MADDRRCLHCDETKASIKREGIVVCGIVSGYYEPELTDEWPHHRGRDWTDAELDRMGIRVEAYERHRRTQVTVMQWVACEDLKRGHTIATQDEPDWGVKAGGCIACGKTPEPSRTGDPS